MIETELHLPIRPYDVDVAGIVSNIVYVRWLEDLRMELLHEHLPPALLRERNLMPVVVRTEINYRASLRFLDRCTGRMRVVEIGRTSVTLDASFLNGRGETAAEAKQVGVFVDTATGRPAPLPDEVRALLGQPTS
ncbi:MAG TPA: thioesterase family protein [Pyrinomonadaceae bacterium]|nr:thioesterase family protein [Pyrinomonadaceae bacterium]